jgi:hypothetical protein
VKRGRSADHVGATHIFGTCKSFLPLPHQRQGAWRMIMQDEKPKRKNARNKKSKVRLIQSLPALEARQQSIEVGLDLVRQYYKRCRFFRKRFLDLKNGNRVAKKRILREFIPLMIEMEREAGTVAKKLQDLFPHQPMTESELAIYLAGRTVRPQAG